MAQIAKKRRSFLKAASTGLVATGAASALALTGKSSQAAPHEAVTQTAETRAVMTPEKALRMLKDGNERFVSGKMLQRDYQAQIKKTGASQFPFAALVGCIDSRESAHLIFDQGIGDVFSARIAGNFVNDDILGSLEYACAAAGARLILVIGHTECGAIKGACDNVVLGNLTKTLANIKPAVAAVSGFDDDRSSANAAFVQAVAEKNVELTMNRIRQRSPILRDMADNGDLGIAGAMYDVTTGKVAFM